MTFKIGDRIKLNPEVNWDEPIREHMLRLRCKVVDIEEDGRPVIRAIIGKFPDGRKQLTADGHGDILLDDDYERVIFS